VAVAATYLVQILRLQRITIEIVKFAGPGGGPAGGIFHPGWDRRGEDELEATF
jgi:hypothetical protein